MKRTSNHPIDPLFLDRWSPRAYDQSSMPKSDLLTIIEAARWAPSANNFQPWRFLYVQREDAAWPIYLKLLNPFNEGWAKNAAALIFILSDSLMPIREGKPTQKSSFNSFDTGAAWAQLALQTTSLGYKAHAMALQEHDEIRSELKIPKQYKVEAAVAIGTITSPDSLPDALKQREFPSQRMSLEDIAFASFFPA